MDGEKVFKRFFPKTGKTIFLKVFTVGKFS